MVRDLKRMGIFSHWTLLMAGQIMTSSPTRRAAGGKVRQCAAPWTVDGKLLARVTAG